MDTPLDCFFADPDEPQVSNRSPSRLDFCLEDSDGQRDHEMDWTCTPFRDSRPYAFINEDAFSVDIAPLDLPHLLLVDPPQATEPRTHEHADTSIMPSVPLERPKKQVVIEPQAPVPVRPPAAQPQIDEQEHVQPPRPASQRLNYPHHGFSRSALLQQKTLWNSRHDEWVEWQSRMGQGEAQTEKNYAYTGIVTAQPSPPPCMRNPPSGLDRDFVGDQPRKHEQDIRPSIYPRVGDISALRDPYSVNVDRCFFRYPLWTLHKTLYVFNMNQRSAPSPPPMSVYDTPQVQPSMSWSTLSSYTSSSTDDEESDSTLVADDSPVPNSQLRPEPVKSVSLPHCSPTWSRLRGWELSWYARWELLIGLLQRDHVQCDGFDTSMILGTSPKHNETLPPPEPIFRFTLGGDYSDEDEDEDDEDEEDYGTVLSHSRFSVESDEECERALAFYCSESKRSEMSF